MKDIIRKEILQKRDLVLDKKDKDIVVFNKLIEMEDFKNCSEIFIYVNVSSEVETKTIINRALKLGKTVAIPYTFYDSCGMEFLKISSLENLSITKFKTLEPTYEEKNVITPTDNSLFIVPLVAFDMNLNRIGYGKGFYDRYFSKFEHHKKIALAYECQKTENAYADKFDIKMDLILTEKTTY